MNANFNEKLEMYRKVKGFLDLHQTITIQIPAFAETFTRFNEAMNKLSDLALDVSTDITGYSEQKNEIKTQLCEICYKVSTGYMLSIKDVPKTQMLEKFNLTLNDLLSSKNADLFLYCTRLIRVTKVDGIDISKYSVSTEDINKLDELINQFNLINDNPKIRIAMRKALNNNIKSSLSDIDTILNEEMDPMINLLKKSNLVFYEGYYNVRAIERKGTRKSADYTNDIDHSTLELVDVIPYDPELSLRISNNGNVTLHFSLSTNAETMDGEIISIDPGQNIQRKTVNMNEKPAEYLLVENKDIKLKGSYKVSFI